MDNEARAHVRMGILIGLLLSLVCVAPCYMFNSDAALFVMVVLVLIFILSWVIECILPKFLSKKARRKKRKKIHHIAGKRQRHLHVVPDDNSFR